MALTQSGPAGAQLAGGRAAFDQRDAARAGAVSRLLRRPVLGRGRRRAAAVRLPSKQFLRSVQSVLSAAAAARRIHKAAGAPQGRHAADRAGDRHRRLACRMACLRSRGDVRRRAGSRHRAQDPAVFGSRALRRAGRLAGLVTSGQGHAGDGKASSDCRHARHQRPPAAARAQSAAMPAATDAGAGQAATPAAGRSPTAPTRRRSRTPNSRRPPRTMRSTGRLAGFTSFTPTNGPSFIQSASTT